MKVSELSGAMLDYWVAKVDFGHGRIVDGESIGPFGTPYAYKAYRPSADWALAGPIIEREGIMIERCTPDAWRAHMSDTMNGYVYEAEEGFSFGETPLEAAMRCYVASKFGDEVDDAD